MVSTVETAQSVGVIQCGMEKRLWMSRLNRVIFLRGLYQLSILRQAVAQRLAGKAIQWRSYLPFTMTKSVVKRHNLFCQNIGIMTWELSLNHRVDDHILYLETWVSELSKECLDEMVKFLPNSQMGNCWTQLLLKDKYPLPLMTTIVDQVAGSKIFTKLDG